MLSAALPACFAYHPASGDMVIVKAQGPPLSDGVAIVERGLVY
jgi:hypothetical protein